MGKRPTVEIILFILGTLLLFPGCGPQKSAKLPIKKSSQQTVKQASYPKKLNVVESNAEDIIDDLDRKDWNKATTKLNAIKTNVTSITPQLKTHGIADGLIRGVTQYTADLDKAIAAKNVYKAKSAANQITKNVPDIIESYGSPTDLGKLDYFGREVLLNLEKQNWNIALQNTQRIGERWDNFKNKLDSKYRKDIDQYSTKVAQLKESIRTKDTTGSKKNANDILELVDTLENDFNQQLHIKTAA